MRLSDLCEGGADRPSRNGNLGSARGYISKNLGSYIFAWEEVLVVCDSLHSVRSANRKGWKVVKLLTKRARLRGLPGGPGLGRSSC